VSHHSGDVTIVLPIYNGLPYLHEAIASVLAQTRHDWRLLLIDDASTDGSAEAIDALDDPRIAVRRHTKNVGLYATLAEAVAQVDTEFVSILMQDDRLHPEYLSVVGSLASRFTAADGFWICEDTIDSEGRVIGRGRSSGRIEPIRPGIRPWRRALMKGCIWTISGSYTRRSLLAEVPFRPDLPHCGDYHWFLRASRTRAFVYYQRPLIDLRQHEGQASTRHLRQGRNMAEMCAVMEEQLDQHPADLPVWRLCHVAGWRAWQCARLLAGNLLRGHAGSLWPLTRTTFKFLRLPPRVVIRRWLAWRPDLAAADEV